MDRLERLFTSRPPTPNLFQGNGMTKNDSLPSWLTANQYLVRREKYRFRHGYVLLLGSQDQRGSSVRRQPLYLVDTFLDHRSGTELNLIEREIDELEWTRFSTDGRSWLQR